jgi:hypothetical protein
MVFFGSSRGGMGQCNFCLPLAIVFLLSGSNFASDVAKMKIPSSKFCKFFAYVETKHELHEVKRAQTYTQFESDLFGIQ